MEKDPEKKDILRTLSSSSLMITSNSPSETPSVREVSLDPYLDDIELLTAIEQNALGKMSHRGSVLLEHMLPPTQ